MIRNVYNIVKDSPRRDETLLIITHDEHGGCFDHILPSSAVPPKKGEIGEKGFRFDRLGIRVPMVMIASSIDSPRVEGGRYDHTSFIKTMCKKWGMCGLTERDQSPETNTFERIFSATKRSSWPELPPAETALIENSDADYDKHPLNDLQKSILSFATYVATKNSDPGRSKRLKSKYSKIKTVRQATDFLDSVEGLIKA